MVLPPLRSLHLFCERELMCTSEFRANQERATRGKVKSLGFALTRAEHRAYLHHSAKTCVR